MGAVGQWVVGTLMVAGVGTQIQSADEQKRATGRQVEAQKEQSRQQKKIADIKAQRERRKMVREQRIAQSNIAVASQGDTSSSRVSGASGSVNTQAASAAGFAGQQTQANQSIFNQGLIASEASKDIASAQSKGQIGGAISNLATSSYSIFKQA